MHQDRLDVRGPLVDEMAGCNRALSDDNWALWMVETDTWVVCPEGIVEGHMDHFLLSHISQRFFCSYEDNMLTVMRRTMFWNSAWTTGLMRLTGM
jgi:hypothetical protein